MRSHTFSVCCNAPLMMGVICSACNQQAEIYTEITTDSPEGFEFSYQVLPVIPHIDISGMEVNHDHFRVTYNDESGLHTDRVMFDDVLEWGRHTQLWSPVYVQHHFDEGNDEDYTSIWSWRPYKQVDVPVELQDMEISLTCQHMNTLRREQFIQSVNLKIMGDYLCQLQRHKVAL